MSLIKVEESNTYQWRINLNEKTNYGWSNNFPIDECCNRSDCFGYKNLQVDWQRKLYSSPAKYLYKFCLSTVCDSIFPVSYTCSILDLKGLIFFTTKGKLLKGGNKEEYTLMIIDVSYLNAWDLTEDSTFTIQFSVYHEQEGSNSAKDGKDTSLLETLSNDFSTLYENKRNTDCVLRVGDSQFHVHRTVLSARSSVFSTMFHHDTAENHSGDINIPDIEATVFSDVLYYAYSGKIRGLTADTVMSVYTVADKFNFLELRKECLEFLKSNLTLDNFCEVALVAHTLGEMELEKQVVSFIEEKLDDVLESTSWQQFIKDKTLHANKLLTSALKLRLPLKRKFQDITSN